MIHFSRTLSSAERDDVAAAVKRAEVLTSAEIVVVVDRIAGSWRSWALVVALLIALAAPWPLIELTNISTRTVFACQLLTAAILIALFQPQFMRLKLVPSLLRRRKGHEAALREFAARGLAATRDRTGVLIYLALAERYAEIITDAAISAQIDDDVWRSTIDKLIAAIDQDQLAQGLSDVVTDMAGILAAKFPPRADDGNELDNKVIVI